MNLSHTACIALVAGAAASCLAQDWTNSGGNAGRNGLTSQVGPDAATVLWSTGRPSIIAWQPVTEGPRVFMVRQSGFPPEPNSNLSPVVGMDLNTGAELWPPVNITFNTGDWTTWVAGLNNGRVYASRSGGGGNVTPFPNGQAKMYGIDVVTGAIVYTSVGTTCAGPYEGAVFAPNGDLIIGDFRNITRLKASDGTYAWQNTRVGSVGGSCGAAINAAANAVYVCDAVAGGHVIKRFDLDTGTFRYQGPLMPGLTVQNQPLVGPDGTIYMSRTQNNAAVDFFYAFNDTGTAITQRWVMPAAWTTTSEYGVGPDGNVYMVAPGYLIKRLSSVDGSTLNTSTVVVNDYSQRMGVDALGRLFYSNGEFGVSTVHSFNADLTLRWSVPVSNVNIGAPAIGQSGTLIVAGTNLITAYRTAAAVCYANCDGSTAAPILTANDFTCFLNAYANGQSYANCDGVGGLTANDFACFLNAYAVGCP
jgi:hypothetical protein